MELPNKHIPRDLVDAAEFRQEAIQSGAASTLVMQAVGQFVPSAYPSARCAFIVGSYALGKMEPLSDVDVFIIDDTCEKPIRRQLLFDKFPLQCAALSAPFGNSLIENGSVTGNPGFLHAFASAIHVVGEDKLTAFLRDRARLSLESGPPDYPEYRINRTRLAIINMYIKVLKSKQGQESFATLNSICLMSAKYLQMIEGRWLYDDSKYDDFLRTDERYKSIREAMHLAMQGNTIPFLSAVWDLLSSFGKPDWSSEELGVLPLLESF